MLAAELELTFNADKKVAFVAAGGWMSSDAVGGF